MRKLINKLLEKKNYQIIKYGKIDYFSLLLHQRLVSEKEFFFIQIGANDGISFDPIYDFVTKNLDKVEGIALEPVPLYFEQLQRNYKKYPNVLTLNNAIHINEKEMNLYMVDPEKLDSLPDSVKGISSFNSEHFKKSHVSDKDILVIKVECLSMDDLMTMYNINKLDLLQIDTEGYDSEIILNYNFNNIRPAIIHFEHGLESNVMTKGKLKEVIGYLNNNDYQAIVEDWDGVAFDLHEFSKY